MILVLMGPSATGKDTIQRILMNKGFSPIVSTTTRPRRTKEIHGKDYFFVSDEEFEKLIAENKFVEYRTYNTVQDGKPAVWKYGSPAVDAANGNYVVVLDKQGADDYKKYYNERSVRCFTVLVKTSDEIRRQRAEKRGSFDEQEWLRRLADDAKVFANVDADLTVYNDEDVNDTAKTILDAARPFMNQGK